MAFHPNQHTQGNIFPNRSQGIDHNQDIGQSLSPINSFTGSLGSFSSRQFDPTGYDNRTYLNSADPWKSNSSLLQQEQNATSPSLRNSLPSGGHGDLSSIQNISAPTSGFSNQTIRMMQNNNTQVPYFNQTSLVSASQSPYSDYQNISTSNGQSQAMSVAHMAPQSPTASFIRRYSGNTNMINGIDPSSLTNGMGYSNPGYTGQVGGLDNFGRNNLNQYVENDNVISNSILKSKSEAMTGLQYASSSNLGSGSTHSNLMNNDSNAMSHENHFQSGGNIESNYSTGFSQDAEYQRSPHSLPLTRPSNISRSQFPSETVAPNQVSTTPIKIPKARPLIIKDSSTVSPNALTKSKHEDHDLSIKPKSAHSPKSKAFSSKPNSSLSLNATPTGQKLKRPMNAFLIYASERRPQLQQSDPTMTTAAQSKMLGEEWAK
ncbi:DNA binding, partial [Basidiobolus ranarum]